MSLGRPSDEPGLLVGACLRMRTGCKHRRARAGPFVPSSRQHRRLPLPHTVCLATTRPPHPTPPSPAAPPAPQLACLFVVSAHNPLPAQLRGPVLLHAAVTGAVQPVAAAAQQMGKGVATAATAGVQQVQQLPPVRVAGAFAQRVGRAAATGAQQVGRAAATGAQQVGKGLAAVPGVQQVQRAASNLGRGAAGWAAAGLAAAGVPGLARSHSAPTGSERWRSAGADGTAAAAAAEEEGSPATADVEAPSKGAEAAAAEQAAAPAATVGAAAGAAWESAGGEDDPSSLKAALDDLADSVPAGVGGEQVQQECLVTAAMTEEEEMVADLGWKSHWRKASRAAWFSLAHAIGGAAAP